MGIEHERGDYLTPEQVSLGIYVEALLYLSDHGGDVQQDALGILGGRGYWGMGCTKTDGFLRACMYPDNEVVLKLAKIFPDVDVARLADALRVEYAIRKLGGRP